MIRDAMCLSKEKLSSRHSTSFAVTERSTEWGWMQGAEGKKFFCW